jgi:hypothetical protein
LIARTTHCVTIAAVILMAAMAVPLARAQTPGAELRLLDVPYLPQSEALCGGAAIAMVMRFFGATNVYAETFSDLVDREAAGIRGKDLLTALQTRGWQAQSFRGDASLVQAHLQARRPVVALIEDRPGRYHYVVIVGWSAGRIILHDPAKAPFRILDEAQFSKAWSESGFWTLVTTPPAEPSSSEPVVRSLARPDSTRDTSGTCPAMVDEGVRLAAKGDLEGGRRLLEVAAAACPASAAPWREMAGIHALQSEWRQAADDARQALAKDAADPLASRILATALYLDGDSDGALTAWNHVGEPSIDLVNVTGLERTRYLVVAREMGLRPQILLTRAALEAARRRLAELPAAQTTRVSYRPGENGRAQVDAVVLERPRFPVGPIPLAATALRAVTDRELAASIASPTGGGELWSASWRWWEHRPRVAGSFAAPSPYGGVWRMEAFAEKQSYADGSAIVEESRRRAAFQASNWTSTAFRWQMEAAVDSWPGSARSYSFGLSGEQRFQEDRLAVHARAAAWAGGVRTTTLGAGADWRSSSRHEGDVWVGRAGVDVAGGGAPLALWPGAGTGQGRPVLLRAHPLLRDGVVDDGVFGRRLLHGGLEWRRWTPLRGRAVRIAPALFIDAARAAGVLPGADARAHLDAGAGVRIAVPGAGVLRVDLARGIRDGSTALSIGWTR